jgi:hypothetical protein
VLWHLRRSILARVRSIVSGTEALSGLIVVVVTMDRVGIAGIIGSTAQIRGRKRLMIK